MLQLIKFNLSNVGYYWCQIVVNNETLPPSPYGYIYSNQCILFDVTCNVSGQPLCAHTSTSRQMAHTMLNGQNCTLENSDITNNSTITTVTLPEMDNNTGTVSKMHTTITLSAATTVTVTDDDFTTTVFDTDSEVKCDFSRNGYKCSIGVMVSFLFFIIVFMLGLTVGIFIFCRSSQRRNKGK